MTEQPGEDQPAGHPPDEVDALVSAWQRERPDLDVSVMQVLSRVTRLAHHLDQQRRRAFGAHGLEPWEFDVLAALRRSGTPYRLSPGQLLRETHVTSGTMTNRVDRLTARGLVRREDHPDDRRGVLVTLTTAGRQTVDATLQDLLAAEEAILAVVDDQQRDQLTAMLRTLISPHEAPSGPAQTPPDGQAPPAAQTPPAPQSATAAASPATRISTASKAAQIRPTSSSG